MYMYYICIIYIEKASECCTNEYISKTMESKSKFNLPLIVYRLHR